MAQGLSWGLYGEKLVIVIMNSIPWLITEEIFLLDLGKNANSMFRGSSNYVPFHLRQSGTFTPFLTGKFIYCGASKSVSRSGLSGETVVCEDGLLYSSLFIDIHE